MIKLKDQINFFKKKNSIPELILRVGIFGSFFGHGIFALQVKTSWLPYFSAVGLTEAIGARLLPLIGIIDIIVACLVLIRPFPLVLAWATIWGFWTALLRPIAGESFWDFIERWANWAAPLALLFLQGLPKTLKGWFNFRR
ncbi:MAG TPA: hypothetical protein VJI98_00085 [Candidatus Nanoarchaeia archaeon]|nr:hypothetical protein [Candidatus Nanoarchaeia archaeon]